MLSGGGGVSVNGLYGISNLGSAGQLRMQQCHGWQLGG